MVAREARGAGDTLFKTGFVDIYDMGGDGVPSYNTRAISAAKHFIKLAKHLDLNFPERTKSVFVVRVSGRIHSPNVPRVCFCFG